jgi:hypothetical protein
MAVTLPRWPAAAALIIVVLGGCAACGAASGADGGASSASPSARPAARPAGASAQDRLESALLASFPRLAPITAPQSGTYDTLPAAEVADGAQATPPGATIKPANCKPAIWAGPDPKRFGKAPASMVAFRKPGDTSAGGVQAWEELVVSNGQSREAALGTGPLGGCATVRASHEGNTLAFAEKRPPSLGTGSRGALLTPSSPQSRRTWVTTFVGNGYVGVVLLQGDVTKGQVDAFASAAYKAASRKLG